MQGGARRSFRRRVGKTQPATNIGGEGGSGSGSTQVAAQRYDEYVTMAEIRSVRWPLPACPVQFVVAGKDPSVPPLTLEGQDPASDDKSFRSALPKESEGEVQQQREDDAQHDHSGDRHVDPHVVALVNEVARQVAKIDHAAEKNDESTQKDEPEAQVDQTAAEAAGIHRFQKFVLGARRSPTG